MAGSRLEKFGTVFTRVRDLMLSGVIKPSNKPIWYDVYEAFPPIRDPVYVTPHNLRRYKKPDRVPDIFYKEDEVRARFFDQYGTGPLAFNLLKPNFVSTCQRFVMCYTDLQTNSCGEVKPSDLFDRTTKTLEAEGVVLKKREHHRRASRIQDSEEN
ncbi:small ribosomal subunit protein mS23 [Austrofundulus limnaeus]|uniref:Small ribosomal subunit protein mS23 n=1 Tax=Austrofundulus limnaeus TaxID=52670 RepID=A0A2I4AJK0_AUSLI|nr:PREDICTED: 28S ribosomal protein S23, mitochondrial [Austrofundulus limnaeus]